MYDKIYIFGIISAISLISMFFIPILAHAFLPTQIFASVVLPVISIFFLIFCLSLAPLFIKAVLTSNIAIWKKFPARDNSTFQSFRNFVIVNEVRIFYILLVISWGVFILGALIALPEMIKTGFFDPKSYDPKDFQ